MKTKRILRNLVLLGIALSVLAIAVWQIRIATYKPDPDYVNRVAAHIEQKSITPLWDLEVLMKSGDAFRSGRWGVCVREVAPVAGDPERLLVCVDNEHHNLQTGDGLFHVLPDRVAFAPNGQAYRIEFSAEIVPPLIRKTLAVLMLAGILAAWLALAVWIYEDARSRLAKAAPAWLLIGVLTGPVGLAVWLVVRGDDPGAHCPHCGAPRVQGTAFCVSCGKPLQLRCPACGKPVHEGWRHCGACGAALNPDAGGGDDRVLADEDRAG
jgi:hypothetical protein